jgi:DNA-binding NtrC family response regulator
LHWRRVEDSAGMKNALAEEIWDVVISEDRMPAFDSRDALAVLRASAAEVPLVVVSGKVAEETAMAALCPGAADFVSNDRLDRLGSAVARSLRHTGEGQNGGRQPRLRSMGARCAFGRWSRR